MFRRVSPVAVVALLLAGCGDVIKHELSVSDALVRAPVRRIVILEPIFARKVKRIRPEDYVHMRPDRQDTSGPRIREILTASLSASLTVDTTYVPDVTTREWAAEIGEDLCRDRVPLAVEPIAIPAEAVLLTGVQRYGWENEQIQYQFLWFKRRQLGKPKYAHAVRLQMILVEPRTGDILLDLLEGRGDSSQEGDELLLDRLTREVADVIARALPVPAGFTPRPAAPSPSPLPTPAPSGTSF